MDSQDRTDPIGDDEILYRRIPVSMNWYVGGHLSPEAFGPRLDDKTGISVSRATLTTIVDAAKGMSRHGYYVALLLVRELREHGITVVPRPELDNPGHAEISDLTCDNADSPEAVQLQYLLATLTIEVSGPYLPNA